MKQLILSPAEWIKTQDGSSGDEERRLENLDRRVTEYGWKQEKSIYVMQFQEIPGRYIIHNGNTRATIAERSKRNLKALLIENKKDYQQAEDDEKTGWGFFNVDDWRSYSSLKDYLKAIYTDLFVSEYSIARNNLLKAALKHNPHLSLRRIP